MRLVTIAAGLAVLTGMPLRADPPGPTAEEMIARSQQVFGEQRAETGCAKHDADEIVVCLDRRTDQRVPSTAQTDPNSRAARRALDGNIPRAPFVGAITCLQGKDGVCRGNMGGAPTPVYYLDVSALPAPPAGSDADRIAKGEAPAP